MRRLLLLLPLLVAACGAGGGGPVATGPLSGKEQALIVAAEGAQHTGDFTSAERDYQSAIAQRSGHVDAHLGLARLYMERRQTAKAREVLESAQQLQPNQPDVNYLLGKVYLGDNKPDLALAAFERGIDSEPANGDLLNGAAIASDMLRLHPKAQSYYQRALTAHAGDPAVIRTNLAMSYLLDNKPKKAVELLQNDAKSPNASPVTKANLALAYGMLGRNAEAKKLVGKEMTESDRMDAVKRLKAYIAQEPREYPLPNIPGGKK